MGDIASKMLLDTADLVSRSREETYGDMLTNNRNIARVWTSYLLNHQKLTLEASDVANMMELLKVARRQGGNHTPDDYADGAGYAAVALECKVQEQQQREHAKKLAHTTEAPAQRKPPRRSKPDPVIPVAAQKAS